LKKQPYALGFVPQFRFQKLHSGPKALHAAQHASGVRIDLSIPTTVLLYAVLLVTLPHAEVVVDSSNNVLVPSADCDDKMFQLHSSPRGFSPRTARESAAGSSLADVDAASEDGAAVTSNRSSPSA
jgi:hypothetical protein